MPSKVEEGVYTVIRKSSDQKHGRKSSQISDLQEDQIIEEQQSSSREEISASSSTSLNTARSSGSMFSIRRDSSLDLFAKNEVVNVSVRITTGQTAEISLEEEASILQHTSLETIAYQLLDCQHILSVIREQMVSFL